jgi:hypothetical protein
MGVYRSDELEEQYGVHKQTVEFQSACGLCTSPAIQTFRFWKIMPAKFPYDLISVTHNMLLPLRHVAEQDLTDEERAEFMEIKHSDALQHTYDSFLESTHRTRSIPPHFHLHLLVLK